MFPLRAPARWVPWFLSRGAISSVVIGSNERDNLGPGRVTDKCSDQIRSKALTFEYTGDHEIDGRRVYACFLCGRFLRTGDLGKMDEGTYLKITGRIKEQFKLENGKYVVPSPIEAAIVSSTYISQVRGECHSAHAWDAS